MEQLQAFFASAAENANFREIEASDYTLCFEFSRDISRECVQRG